ncbi:MAG: diphthine--ammonia ligase [Bacillota bacterium]|nr:diphthine--ammonia ligase [Bacillota bacterium]
MKFVMSYSCGKDSTLALHKLLEEGHKAVALLVMVNKDAGRSWFHGADDELLNKYSRALEIPLILCPAKGEEYHLAFEEGLRKAMAQGAELAVFGDIDIERNRRWCVDRCEAVGIGYRFPLWQRNRREIVDEIISTGYSCLIKAINNEKLPKDILGMTLGAEVIEIMEEHNIDVCGENGEYHTIAVGGPIFKHKLKYTVGERLDFGITSVIDIR